MLKNKIDFKDVDAKLQKIKIKIENPHNKLYREKLGELLNTKTNARDNFINWITGLATGSILFAFSNGLSPSGNLRGALFLSAAAFFFCIVSAMIFKIFLEVRFSTLEIEVSLVKTMYEGYDIRTQLKEMNQSGEDISEEDKQRLLENMKETLNYLDEDRIEKLKRPINIKSKLLTYFYWQTLTLFFFGITLMAGDHAYLFQSTYKRQNSNLSSTATQSSIEMDKSVGRVERSETRR
jgi:hypothetical protein